MLDSRFLVKLHILVGPISPSHRAIMNKATVRAPAAASLVCRTARWWSPQMPLATAPIVRGNHAGHTEDRWPTRHQSRSCPLRRHDGEGGAALNAASYIAFLARTRDLCADQAVSCAGAAMPSERPSFCEALDTRAGEIAELTRLGMLCVQAIPSIPVAPVISRAGDREGIKTPTEHLTAALRALVDRASFRRFCGFSAQEPTPERTAFVRFRREFLSRGLDQMLFEEVTAQLRAKAVTVKTGTLIDATVTASASHGDGEAA
jgi:hypothetical protein